MFKSGDRVVFVDPTNNYRGKHGVVWGRGGNERDYIDVEFDDGTMLIGTKADMFVTESEFPTKIRTKERWKEILSNSKIVAKEADKYKWVVKREGYKWYYDANYEFALLTDY